MMMIASLGMSDGAAHIPATSICISLWVDESLFSELRPAYMCGTAARRSQRGVRTSRVEGNATLFLVVCVAVTLGSE